MRLTIHRGHFGVDPDGQWHQRINDEWYPIPRPEWSKKKKQEKVVDITMREPEGFVRKTPNIEMVTVYKVAVKSVPDYEAEVLCRNGWTTEAPIFACRIDESAGMKQLTLDTA